MIEYVLVFLAGIGYGLVGISIHDRTEHHLNRALMDNGIHPGTYWGIYSVAMLVLLWPVLAFLFVLTTGYVTLSGVSE